MISATRFQKLEVRNDKPTLYKSEIKTDPFQIMRMQNGVKLDTARYELGFSKCLIMDYAARNHPAR